MAYPKPSEDIDPVIQAELAPGMIVTMRLSEARRRGLRVKTPTPTPAAASSKKRTTARNKRT